MVSKQNKITRQDGSQATLRVFRCLACSRIYDDDDWQTRCQAQPQRAGRPPSTGRGPRKEDLLQGHTLKLDEAEMPAATQQLLEELRRQRGIK